MYGNNTIAGNLGDDVLIGGIGNDTLIGGLGNDILKGGSGNDSYLFNVGDGEDTLTDTSGIDKIVFGEGITADNIRISPDTTQLHWIVELLDINGATTDDKIWIREANIGTDNRIESFEFSDGTSLGADEINAMLEEGRSDGSTDIDNEIYAIFPEQPLYGTDGNDLFIGDIGAHSYHINASAGHDVIKDTAEDYRGQLVLNDIYDWQVSAIRDGNDLVINILSGEEQSIRIVDQYLGLGIDSIIVKDSNPHDDSVRTYYYADLGSRSTYSDYGSYQVYRKDLDDLFRPPANGYDGFDFDGSELAEVIDGTDGNDTFNGGKGDDTYVYNLGDGNDIINDSYGSNRVDFGDGITIDNITVRATGNVWSPNIIVDAPNGQSVTIGTENSDDTRLTTRHFRFFDGSEWGESDILANMVVSGTEGDDTFDYKKLYSGTTFEMGLGNDTIFGGTGDDKYLFNFGDGQDILSDNRGTDKIVFGEGITADNLRITHDSTESHWIVELLDDNGQLTGDKVTIENAYADAPHAVGGEPQDSYLVESFEFSDGTSMSLAEIQLAAETLYSELETEPEVVTEIEGTSGDDELVGDDQVNIINGFAGNDTLSGGLGNDIVDGGKGDDAYLYNLSDGNDHISDYSGSDTLRFGAGIAADNISISANDTDMQITLSDGQVITIANWNSANTSRLEQFEFADGTVWASADILSAMVITGSEGDGKVNNKYLTSGTTYNMGLGDDTMYGGKGDDAYLYNLGDGNDHISDYSGSDSLRFGTGITADNISISANDTDMLITLSDGQVITIANWNSANTSRLEQFEFADGTVWEAVDILANMVIVGSDGDGKVNNKYLTSGTTYDMGLGDDTMYGGKDDDAYLYNLGDGNDHISDYSGSDSLRFGAGITADNISVSANDTDMLITLSDGQVITIANWNSANTSRLEQFEFADGAVWASADILANMVITGTDGDGNVNNKYLVSGTTYNMGLGDDTMYGGKGDDAYLYNLSDGNDHISDYSGSDTLRFGAGISADNISVSANDTDMLITLSDGQVITIANWNSANNSRIEQFEFSDGTVWEAVDILANMVITGTVGDGNVNNKYLTSGTTYDMGLGDDTMYGGKGDDVYLYNLSDGNDHISDYSGSDTLRFGAGISADNISISANDTDMLITLPDGQVITIANWNSANNSRIEQFEFADGTVWEAVDIISNILVEANVTPKLNQAELTNSGSGQRELFSEVSSIDAYLNLLIQSYSSFDDGPDESGLKMSKDRFAIVLPVIESIT